MAIQTINIGQQPNDGTGDPARDAFAKANANFQELDQGVSQAQGTADDALAAANAAQETGSSALLAAETAQGAADEAQMTATAASGVANAAIPQAEKGGPGGVAPLGDGGLIPADHLPLADESETKAGVAVDRAITPRGLAGVAGTHPTAIGRMALYAEGDMPSEDVGDIWVEGKGPYRWDADEQAYAAVPLGDGKPLLYLEFAPSRSMIAAGFAPADGQLLPAATYPDVVPMLLTGNVPVVSEAEWLANPLVRGCWTLGEGGDGSVNFRTPDYNGVQPGSTAIGSFRGDGARSAGVAGTIQRDALQNITGEFASIRNNRAALGSASGAFFRTGIENLVVPGGTTGSPTLDGIGFDASRVARTADETRSINVTGCWTVKLFGALINPGSADAAQLASDFAALASALQSLTGRVAALESRPRGLFTRGSLGSFSLPGGTYTIVNLAEAAPFNEGVIRVAAGVYAVAEAGMYAFSFCGQVAATTGTSRFLRVDVLDANSAVLKTYSDGFIGYSGTNSLIAVDGLAWLDPSDTIQITAYQGDNSAQSQSGGEHIWHFHLARVA